MLDLYRSIGCAAVIGSALVIAAIVALLLVTATTGFATS